MADDIKVQPSTGVSDPAVATDEVGGKHYQKVKIALGAEDAVDTLVDSGQQTSANSVPVVIASDQSAVHVIVDSGAGAGTQYTEDAAAAADPVGNALIMVRDDALSGQTTADGDNIAARGTDKGELYVKHVDAVPVTDNSGSLTVDNAALSVVGGGAEATALRVTIANDSTGVISVDDNGGSLTVDVGAALPAGGNNIGDVDIVSGPTDTDALQVRGTVAHDGPAAINPVQIAGEARSSERAAVDPADVARLVTDLAGKLITRPHCNPENQVSGVASKTDTTDAAVVATQGVGVRIYVTSISVANSSANNPVIEIKSASTVIWRTIAPASGGSNITFDPPLRLNANEALNMASLTSSTTVYFSANGYAGA